jgi:hypothetical protein
MAIPCVCLLIRVSSFYILSSFVIHHSSFHSVMSTLQHHAPLPGKIAGRPMEEWNAAYVKVESYFQALRIRNRVLLGELVQKVLDRAMKRAPAEPQRSTTELATEEMDLVVTEWFANVLERIPTGVEHVLNTRGRLALLLADMPGKWQDQFLSQGPWPKEFVDAMQEAYLRAGPDFQLSQMTPRPLDLGPITTLTNLGNLPIKKMLIIWCAFFAVLGAIFWFTR